MSRSMEKRSVANQGIYLDNRKKKRREKRAGVLTHQEGGKKGNWFLEMRRINNEGYPMKISGVLYETQEGVEDYEVQIQKKVKKESSSQLFNLIKSSLNSVKSSVSELRSIEQSADLFNSFPGNEAKNCQWSTWEKEHSKNYCMFPQNKVCREKVALNSAYEQFNEELSVEFPAVTKTNTIEPQQKPYEEINTRSKKNDRMDLLMQQEKEEQKGKKWNQKRAFAGGQQEEGNYDDAKHIYQTSQKKGCKEDHKTPLPQLPISFLLDEKKERDTILFQSKNEGLPKGLNISQSHQVLMDIKDPETPNKIVCSREDSSQIQPQSQKKKYLKKEQFKSTNKQIFSENNIGENTLSLRGKFKWLDIY